MDMMFHGGLGDAIICNAIVRNFSKLYDYLNIFIAKNNENVVKFMFRDIKNVNYIIWGHDRSLVFDGFFTEENSDFYKWYNNNIKSGFDGLLGDVGANLYDISDKEIIRVTNKNQNIPFDMAFYECVNLDFEKRWSDFYFERDFKKEKEVFKSLNIKENEYVFIHDGGSGGNAIVDLNKIRKDLPIIKSSKDIFYFDYCYTIENAKEVHCINSSFMPLVDSIETKGDLFFHFYTKPSISAHLQSLKKKLENFTIKTN